MATLICIIKSSPYECQYIYLARYVTKYDILWPHIHSPRDSIVSVTYAALSKGRE